MITLIVVVLLGVGGYVYYTSLKKKATSEGGAYDGTLKPRLELSQLDITNISDKAISMNLKLLIDNPLPVGFKARRLDYTVYVDNEEVVKDAYDKTVDVKSGDSTLVSLPVNVFADKLNRVLKRLEARHIDSTDYRVQAIFDLDVPLAGERTFTVSKSVHAPTFFIPEINVADVDLGKFGLKNTDVAAKLICTNKNKFPFNITDAQYSVKIDGKEIADGKQGQPILIKAQDKTSFVLPVTVKPGQSLGLLPKMLFDKKDTPVEIAFRCKILDKDNDPMFKNSQLVTTIRSTLAELTKK